jgi:hypothetical protein
MQRVTAFVRLSVPLAVYLVPVLLFFVLSPGLLLTLPPSEEGVFLSGETSRWAIFVHTLVFALVYFLLLKYAGRFLGLARVTTTTF